MERISDEICTLLAAFARIFIVAPARWLWAVLCVTRREICDTVRDIHRLCS